MKIKWKFPFHLNGFFDTKLVLGFVGSGKAFYWSSDSRWEPPRNGAASHYILQTGEVLFKRKMRKKRLYWPMNGRFIYVNWIIFRNGWQCLLTWKEFMRHKIKLSSLKSCAVCFLCVSLTIVSFKRFILSLVPDFLWFPYYREEIHCGTQGVFLYDLHWITQNSVSINQ